MGVIYRGIDHNVLSLFDVFSRYNMISMVEVNILNTTFITEEVNYLYEVMPFDLKGVEVIYQKLMDSVFKYLLDKCVVVYTKNIVIKSPTSVQHS